MQSKRDFPQELTDMLHSVEEKGQAIGKMAKEKLTKYKTENEALQAKVTSLETGSGEIGDEVDGEKQQLEAKVCISTSRNWFSRFNDN